MKNILVPIDYSPVTDRVLDVARSMAEAFTAEIHVIHVREVSSALPTGGMGYETLGVPELLPTSALAGPMLEQLPEITTADGPQEVKLKNWQEEIGRAGLKASVHEATGRVVDEICNRAHAVNANLIVMGRHGHGAMYNLLVGSVTEGVLKHSKCPVLLVADPRS